LKEGCSRKKTCFPSQALQLAEDNSYFKGQAVLGEIADLLIQLEYIHYRLPEYVSEGTGVPSLRDVYFGKRAECAHDLREGLFVASASGNLYRTKGHVHV
jgi:hypothetical protein